MKKILRNEIKGNQQDLIEANYRNKELTLRKKVIKERTRSIKIDLTAAEARKLLFFLEEIVYEKGENVNNNR